MTLRLWATRAAEALAGAGVDTPRLDAELLLADAAGIDRSALVTGPEEELPAEAAVRADEYLARRVEREPVAYILGRRAFRRIELLVDRRVLIPRPDTELLVEVCLGMPRDARVHEVGTGSGAVALALRDERPDLSVSASERSPEAAKVARENAARLGIALEVAVLEGLPSGAFDLVVANLPYVRDLEWARLAPEITRYEPREALLGGPDGLREIRTLVSSAPPGTLVALEHAPDQAPGVRELLASADTRRDLAGRERATIGRTP